MKRFALLLCLAAPLAGGCGPGPADDDDSGDDDDAAVEFALWSPDFVSSETVEDNTHDCAFALPPEFSCFNPNPEIRWEGAPEGTVAFALIFDDPTAGNFPHWAIFNVPGSTDGLDASVSGTGATGNPPEGAIELENDAGQVGYLGSCPNPGSVNRYSWRLYALDAELTTSAGATFAQLEADAQAAELDHLEMCHVFDGDDRDL